MEIKRKVALIILVGLLASLLGSFSYLIGMETAVIKDVNGQEFILNQAQKNALGQCKTLKSMLQDCENAPQIDFEGLAAPVFKDTVLQLLQCIENPKNIDQIPDSKIVDLFKLADYLHAPKEITSIIAERVEKIAEERFLELSRHTSLSDQQQNQCDECQALWQSTQKYLELSVDKWYKKKLIGHPGRPNALPNGDVVDLSAEKNDSTRKKIRQLSGLEVIPNSARVETLVLNYQGINQLDLEKVKKHFPNLRFLSIINNKIKNIDQKRPLNNLTVDLRGNPLESITITDPQLSKNLLFLNGNAQVGVDFKQSRYARAHTWLKSLWAKIKLIKDVYAPSASTVATLFAAGVALKLGYNIIQEIPEILPSYKPDPEALFLVVDNNFAMPVDEEHAAYIEIFKVFHKTELTQFKNLKHLFPQTLGESAHEIAKTCAQKWVGDPLRAGFSTLKVVLPGLIGLKFLADPCLTEIIMLCNQRAEFNPYRVRVRVDEDQIIKEFPSNYTYNLLGKF